VPSPADPADRRAPATRATEPGPEPVEAVLELTTGAPAAGGGCVARAGDGRVVFVRHALPGERVRARVTSATRHFLRADAVEVLEAAPGRVAARCPHAGPGRCGGCDYQHAELGLQRSMKAQLLAEQLRRLAGLDQPVAVHEVPGSPDGLGWRTRVRYAVDREGRPGLRRHRSHELELIDRCPIAVPGIQAIGIEGRRWPGVHELEAGATPDGGQRLVSVTTAAGRGREPDGAIDAGVVVDGRVRRRPGALVLHVAGREFSVRAGSFWQVHVAAPEVLGRAVLDAAGARAGDTVVDLYAGVGLFSALVATAVGPTGSVLAVERDARACEDAVANTADLPQVTVRRSGVTPALVGRRIGRPDLVVLDPPREGAGQALMAALAALRPAPRRIVYVSCDAGSFARDLRVLLDAGWDLGSLTAYDLFPMTEHVEVVAAVSRPPA